MSGESNVTFWLKQHGEKVTARKVEEICQHAKAADHTLSDDEIWDVLERMDKT